MKENIKIDAKLVEQYQSGNALALAELVERWHKTFCNKAYWLVKNQDVAKDIAQDSWKTIINKMDSLNDVNSFGSWALRIVYTKSLDWIKYKNKEREKLQEYHKFNNIQEVKTDDNVQLKLSLLKAVKGLPENQQVVIRLFYVEDYVLKEISEILNISIGTAKSRLFHAREKLKEILKINRSKK